jgi:transposase
MGIVITMTIYSAIGGIRCFENPKKLVGGVGLEAEVHDNGQKHRDKSLAKSGRKELHWALIEAAWQATRSNSHWRAKYVRLFAPGSTSGASLLL